MIRSIRSLKLLTWFTADKNKWMTNASTNKTDLHLRTKTFFNSAWAFTGTTFITVCKRWLWVKNKQLFWQGIVCFMIFHDVSWYSNFPFFWIFEWIFKVINRNWAKKVQTSTCNWYLNSCISLFTSHWTVFNLTT